jgi:hypothetical protein
MTKKYYKELRAVLDAAEADYDFEPGKTHIKITVRSHGRSRALTVSSSPSCRHATNQFRRDLRKVLHELEEGLEPGAMWSKG